MLSYFKFSDTCIVLRRQSFSKQNGYHLRRSLESTSTEAGVQAGSPSRNPDKLSEADSKSQKELDSMRQELKTIKEFSEEQEARLTQTKQKLQQVSVSSPLYFLEAGKFCQKYW